ncbi:MAG: DNA primase [Candidatus Portnoybacteria bacterium]|nr:DNA primase [Candidatus Portnoybacteria bacterium]
MFSPVEEIKNRLDIVEVIGSYIKLEKAGRNWRARCPFHAEKTPSFMVSQERQIWHCFGCGTGGDIFAFVKQIDGLEFGDALRILAQRAGVTLKKQDAVIQTKRRRLYEICQLSSLFFKKQLESKIGQKAYLYLKQERGIEAETIKKWGLGWAPDGWQNLSDFLKQKGYNHQEIFDAGMVIKKEGENFRVYDRFRSRIMFPIFDIQGQVIGFAGRIFGKEEASAGKYINTPQTFLYDKSRVLFGLNFAKQAIRQQDACVFVEGNLDVIMSHQAGVENAVASSGTALTVEHLKIIKRYSSNIIFSFDTDLAGQTATRRSIDQALVDDFEVRVVQMEEKDPADLIKQDAKQWKKIVEKAAPFVEYSFNNVFKKFKDKNALKAEEKKQIGKILLPVVKRIPNQIEQAHWIGELSKKLKTDEKILFSEMRKMKAGDRPVSRENQENNTPALKKRTRTRDLEERIISLWLNYPEFVKDFSGSSNDIFFSPDLADICCRLRACAKEEKNLKNFRKKLIPEMASLTDFLALKGQQIPPSQDQIGQELVECIKELRILKVRKAMTDLSFEIKADKNKPDKIMEFRKLASQREELEK